MIIDTIKRKISDALSPVVLEVIDESYKHAGHAGVAGITGGETHFHVRVVSTAFEGMSRIKRHQKIYDILATELKQSVHALSLKTLTPDENAAL